MCLCLWSVWGVCRHQRRCQACWSYSGRHLGVARCGSWKQNSGPFALQLRLTVNYVHGLQVQTPTLLSQSPQSQGLQVCGSWLSSLLLIDEVRETSRKVIKMITGGTFKSHWVWIQIQGITPGSRLLVYFPRPRVPQYHRSRDRKHIVWSHWVVTEQASEKRCRGHLPTLTTGHTDSQLTV